MLLIEYCIIIMRLNLCLIHKDKEWDLNNVLVRMRRAYGEQGQITGEERNEDNENETSFNLESHGRRWNE
jgi:hypothetical protein